MAEAATVLPASFFGVFNSKEELIERSTIASRITPILKKFVLSKDQLLAILEGIRSVAEISDISLLIVVGWVLVPFIETWYDRMIQDAAGSSSSLSALSLSANEEDYDDDEEYEDPILDNTATAKSLQSSPVTSSTVPLSQISSLTSVVFPPRKKYPRPFRKTKLFHTVNTLSEMAQLGLAVYGADMIKIFLLGAGFDIPKSTRVTHAFAYVIYTLWAFRRLSTLKHYVLRKIQGGSDQGRLQFLDRVTDAGLMLLAAFVLLEILNVQMGVAVKGVVAVGSVWTLVVSLAMKEIVSNFFHGILLSASDRIYEGDSIQMGKSNFRGHVEKLGWLETVLRGSDDIMVTVPNTELQGSQVSNLSRIHVCQVYQMLRFKYGDASQLPKLLHDIKCEIRASCPTVITDGSRPFRCYWTNFQSNYLEVVVDAHFRIRPVGDGYFENRQRVLLAIDRAVKENEMQYA